VAVLFVSLFCGCSWIVASPPSAEEMARMEVKRQEDEQRAKAAFLSQIDLRDGVGEKEAGLMAWNYFYRFISRCGDPGKPVDKGDHWEIPLTVGYGAERLRENLVIDKKTGRIFANLEGMPAFNSPQEMVNADASAGAMASPPDEWVKNK
jgi:hypothetical protein